MIKIEDTFTIKGRGVVGTGRWIGAPLPVPAGRLRRASAGKEFDIRGVERFVMRLGLPNVGDGEAIGLLVDADADVKVGDELEAIR